MKWSFEVAFEGNECMNAESVELGRCRWMLYREDGKRASRVEIEKVGEPRPGSVDLTHCLDNRQARDLINFDWLRGVHVRGGAWHSAGIRPTSHVAHTTAHTTSHTTSPWLARPPHSAVRNEAGHDGIDPAAFKRSPGASSNQCAVLQYVADCMDWCSGKDRRERDGCGC